MRRGTSRILGMSFGQAPHAIIAMYFPSPCRARLDFPYLGPAVCQRTGTPNATLESAVASHIAHRTYCCQLELLVLAILPLRQPR